jgi:hypothetical protein
LLRNELTLRNDTRRFETWDNWDIKTDLSSDLASESGALHTFACCRGDAEQVNVRLHHNIGERDRIIDITADIGVEQ